MRKDREEDQINVYFKDPHDVDEVQKIYKTRKSMEKDGSSDAGTVSAEKVGKTKAYGTKDYTRLLVDYDTSRQSVIPQLNYIGSQYTQDVLFPSMTQAKSLTNFDKETERK